MVGLQSTGLMCALVLVIGACTVKTIYPPHDGGRDIPAPRDAVSDGQIDGAGSDAQRDGVADRPRVCPAPVDCSPDAALSCRATWADVLAAPPMCVAFMSPGAIGVRESRGTCGNYNVVELTYVDWTSTSYYDGDTGQLVAIYTTSGSATDCVAGPSGGIPVCAIPLVVDVCPQDAGTDARD